MNLSDMSLSDHCQDLSPILYSVTPQQLSDGSEPCVIDDSDSEHCQINSHSICQDLGCDQYGVGPLILNYAGDEVISALLLCLPPSYAEGHSLTYVELDMYDSDCDSEGDLKKIDCRYAFQVHCDVQSTDFDTVAIGPLSSNNIEAQFACISGVTRRVLLYEVLAEFVGDCDHDEERFGPKCNQAIHEYCQSENFLTGWGPIAENGQTVSIACISSAL